MLTQDLHVEHSARNDRLVEIHAIDLSGEWGPHDTAGGYFRDCLGNCLRNSSSNNILPWPSREWRDDRSRHMLTSRKGAGQRGVTIGRRYSMTEVSLA